MARDHDQEPEEDDPGQRLEKQALWVEQQVRSAIDRGDFDDLAGAGQPIRDLGHPHDRDWWLKRLIKREQITGVLPPALALRKEDTELNDILDRQSRAESVREIVDDFNRRIKYARLQLKGGPPVITQLRDTEHEVEQWQQRRRERLHSSGPETAASGGDRAGWFSKLLSRLRNHS